MKTSCKDGLFKEKFDIEQGESLKSRLETKGLDLKEIRYSGCTLNISGDS